MGRKQIAENTGRNYVKCLNDLNSKNVEYKMRKQFLFGSRISYVFSRRRSGQKDRIAETGKSIIKAIQASRVILGAFFIFPVQITPGKTENHSKVREQCGWTMGFIVRYNIHSRKILGRLKGRFYDLAAAQRVKEIKRRPHQCVKR